MNQTRREGPAAAWGVIAFVVGLCVAALRVLGMQGFSNDHFFYLTRSAQVLLGAVPVRDFVDPGFPLAIAVSAAAQRVEPTLYAEALVVALAFGISAALTCWAVRRWLGAWPIALWAAFIPFAVLPRSYSYPKILLYVVAATVFLRWARERTLPVAAWLGVVTGTAFLFRHDHGVFIGVASAVLLAGGPGWREPHVWRWRGLAFGAALVAVVAPYLMWVQRQTGLQAYFADGVSFSEREADRTLLSLPALDAPLWTPEGLGVVAYYALWAAPLIALVVVWQHRRRADDMWLVVALVTLAVCANAGFLRDPLAYRVSDAAVPFALLVAWLAAVGWRASGGAPVVLFRRMVLVGVLVALAAGAARLGDLPQTLARAELLRWPPRPWTRWHNVVAELREPFNDDQMPSDVSIALVPFDRYLRACTPAGARVLVTGFAPEVAYFAGRGFAGGHPSLYRGYYASAREQQRIVERLRREQVLFVVETSESTERFADSFPLVQAYLAERFVPLATIPVEGSPDPVRILVNRALPSVPVDLATGWPCPGSRL